ncbi:MAG: hypothetical protein Q7S47_02310 [bacterium]|nr:hypothetical protein [bacterium]
MGISCHVNEIDFDKTKEQTEAAYKKIGSIFCPFFNQHISFNAKGLRHLKFKSDQQARSRSDQFVRLRLLYLAPEVLRKSRTLQGIWETRKFEEQKTNSRWKSVMRDIIFYEFVAVLDDFRVKVIVKEVRGSEKYFWSIIPYWKAGNGNGRRILYSGNPDE